MKAVERRGGGSHIWWWSGLIAGLLVLTTVLLLSFRWSASEVEAGVQPSQQGAKDEAPIGLTRLVQESETNLVAAEAEFLDPTPLFLPTKWNAGQNLLPSSVLRDPGQMFQDFPSRLAFTEESLELKFPERWQIPESYKDTVSAGNDRVALRGMGRGDEPAPKVQERGGLVEVAQAVDGKTVLSEALPVLDIPAGNWRPFELVGVVDAAGLVGQLAFVQSSGVLEIDNFYRDYLVSTLHLGERLRPGFYRIFVGP